MFPSFFHYGRRCFFSCIQQTSCFYMLRQSCSMRKTLVVSLWHLHTFCLDLNSLEPVQLRHLELSKYFLVFIALTAGIVLFVFNIHGVKKIFCKTEEEMEEHAKVLPVFWQTFKIR